MFIYKHTPRRTRLRDLCSPTPPPLFLALSRPPSLSLSPILLSQHVPFSSSSPMLLRGSFFLSLSPVVFNSCNSQILPSSVSCHYHSIFCASPLSNLLCVSPNLPLASTIAKADKCTDTDAPSLQYVKMNCDRTLHHTKQRSPTYCLSYVMLMFSVLCMCKSVSKQ